MFYIFFHNVTINKLLFIRGQFMFSSTFKKKFFYLTVISVFFAALSFGQTREQIKMQAESSLQKMSSEEIEKKLKEVGLTKEEATIRAKEYGLNLEEYLTRVNPGFVQQGQQSDNKETFNTYKPVTPMRSQRIPQENEDQPKTKLSIPGFANRRGIDAIIAPFGYDIFQYSSSTFEPVTNTATPQNYTLGPGDEVLVSVWGDVQLYYQLTVNKEGNIIVPTVGPVVANGLTIQQFREKLLRRMSSNYAGLKNGESGATSFLDVSIGKLKTIQVFVLGEVVKPGSYALSSLATVMQALYFSGGPTMNGTLRDIQVNREGKTLPLIDLYNYILKGDKSKDIRLQDGDVVFVNPVGKRVAVTGDVVRPAVYELKEKETLSALIMLAGGLRFDAYFNRLHVERVVPFNQRKLHAKNILDIDLNFETLSELQKSTSVMEDGDIVTINKVSDLAENKVEITGNIRKPGPYQLKPGMRIRDLIAIADSFQRNTFSERGTLFRLLPNLKREIISFNPKKTIEGNAVDNIVLQNEDSLVIYKESQFLPSHIVKINGAVRNPGTYTRNEKMTVADLIVLAGGLAEDASYEGIEISHLDTTNDMKYVTIEKISIGRDYWDNNNGQRYFLSDFDVVFIPKNPYIGSQQTVFVAGMVMYPGQYQIQNRNERVSDILKRAGGFREGGYVDGAEFYRKKNNAGKITLDFKKILDDPKVADNLLVEDLDSIYIGQKMDIVTILGAVYVPGTTAYQKGVSLDYYIAQGGGFTDEANVSATVVFLPNGKKWEPSWWIFPDPEILAGSRIYVPKKIEREDKTLPVLAQLATILASLAAVTVALVQVTKK